MQHHKLKPSLKCLLVNLDVFRIKEKFDEEFMNLLLLSKHLDCYWREGKGADIIVAVWELIVREVWEGGGC